mmetsp:Transcript_55581/g.154844  ORF Transcript_55581/g.154844 Transcript_55581/m.154844 type:complete len:552 (-) Transcript_55581:14-1669(-)
MKHVDDYPQKESHLFREVNALRKPRVDYDELEKKRYNATICGRIAIDKRFEYLTMVIIVFNALAIAFDTEYAARWEKPTSLYDPEMPIYFPISENIFCLYFTIEIVIRFIGYKTKCHVFFDKWFVFDAVLVTMMIAETWVVPLLDSETPLGKLSILRLVRLLRITRMARIIKSVPMLMLIMRGIAAAVRAVGWTLVLLMILAFAWSILFTAEFHQGKALDDDVGDGVEGVFGSMGKSFLSLIIMGTILDDVTFCSDAIRSTGKTIYIVFFIFFIVISSFMLLNMLLGILVEVVDNTSYAENVRMKEEAFREAMHGVLKDLDGDANLKITRKEFFHRKAGDGMQHVLEGLDITEKHYKKYARLLFEDEETARSGLTYDHVTDMMLMFCPGADIKSLDLAALSSAMTDQRARLKQRIFDVEAKVQELMNKRFGLSSKLRPGFRDPVPLNSLHTTILDSPNAITRRISCNTIAQMERTTSSQIISELQRRLGLVDYGVTGIPLSMLDGDLQYRVKSAEAFGSLNTPQSDPVTREGCAQLPHVMDAVPAEATLAP